MIYGTTSRDYLARARALRAIGTPDALFYAAFEIRCGVEARLHEYMAGAAKVATVKRGLWQIRNLMREVEGVFGVYSNAVVATLILLDTGEKLKLEYTPVSPELKKVGELLGEFLHFTPSHRASSKRFLDRLSVLVDDGISGLAFATRGVLLGPPTGSGPKSEQIRLMFEEGSMPSYIKAGTKMKINMKFILISKDSERIVLKPA
jgi:hypothetical protein